MHCYSLKVDDSLKNTASESLALRLRLLYSGAGVQELGSSRALSNSLHPSTVSRDARSTFRDIIIKVKYGEHCGLGAG